VHLFNWDGFPEIKTGRKLFAVYTVISIPMGVTWLRRGLRNPRCMPRRRWPR